MEQELNLLRQQVAMQHELIGQLLALNRLLKQKLASSGIDIDQTEAVYSNQRAENSAIQQYYSKSRQGDGMIKEDDSNQRSSHGTMEMYDSKPRTDEGINKPYLSNPQSLHGINQSYHSTLRSSEGIKHENSGNIQAGNVANKPEYHLPQLIEPSELNIMRLAVALRGKKVLHMRIKGLKRIALLLIHIYNRGGGSINELKKASGYSAGGMAKLLMNLRKKGILVKHRVRDHRLSAFTLGLLQHAEVK